MRKLGENIRRARIAKNISQEDLAKMLGKSKNVISNWERSDNRPDAIMIEKLCEILDTTPNDLMGWPPDKEASSELKTIAAHFKGKNISEEKLRRIEKFVEFTLNEDEV